jgi:hypothetical protein
MRRLPFLVVIVLLHAISTSTTTTTTLCHAAAADDETMIVSLTRSDSLTVRKQTTSFFFPSFPHQTEERVSLKSKSPLLLLCLTKKRKAKTTHTPLSRLFLSFRKNKKKREKTSGRSDVRNPSQNLLLLLFSFLRE